MLPFVEPDDDLHINLCVVLILLNYLGKTSRGTVKMNNDKLHIFMYLVKNPTAINDVFRYMGKDSIVLHEKNSYSLTTLSPNIDPLFDRQALKLLLSTLISKELVQVVYKKKDGFFYILTETGSDVVSNLKDDYFAEVHLLCETLKVMVSATESQLNQMINKAIRKESF